jgi:hypothetical protein
LQAFDDVASATDQDSRSAGHGAAASVTAMDITVTDPDGNVLGLLRDR